MSLKLPQQPSSLQEAKSVSKLSDSEGGSLEVTYTNYRNETSTRHILPINLYYGNTKYHKEKQWILEVWDLDKDAYREYSLKDITFIK